jgi:hypothetical protein
MTVRRVGVDFVQQLGALQECPVTYDVHKLPTGVTSRVIVRTIQRLYKHSFDFIYVWSSQRQPIGEQTRHIYAASIDHPLHLGVEQM